MAFRRRVPPRPAQQRVTNTDGVWLAWVREVGQAIADQVWRRWVKSSD